MLVAGHKGAGVSCAQLSGGCVLTGAPCATVDMFDIAFAMLRTQVSLMHLLPLGRSNASTFAVSHACWRSGLPAAILSARAASARPCGAL